MMAIATVSCIFVLGIFCWPSTTATPDLASAVKTAKFLYDSLSEAQIQQNYVFGPGTGGGEYNPNTPGNFNYGNGVGINGNGNLNFKGGGNALNISGK